MFANSLVRADDLACRGRRSILEEIHMHEDSPEDVVHDVFTETLWPGHPLGRPILGTEDRIRAATPASVRSFYRRHYLPGNLVVGGGGQRRARATCSGCCGHGWRRGSALGSQGALGVEPARARAARRRPRAPPAVRRKKTEQAHVVLGTNGLPRNDPDRFAFWVVNSALGGGMSSRGCSRRSARSAVSPTPRTPTTGSTRRPGLFSAYAGTTPAKAKEVDGSDAS